ncbi:hypothetical protein SUFG_00017 [Sulfitobacter phage phiCB2047-B]|uniref:Uncharacterized protein n=1 Tax=Sulfitobacter phage phiCB2047-B TaxID=754046 RepID=M4PYG3_9CAUD|nr:hypothetical protein SUFG_00017 [Sulfitobacter phage phiCB2047-B]AGH07389.1 hypothetical protein SUFG_00017 [Sulfitobacter phage phiCB2047-B]
MNNLSFGNYTDATQNGSTLSSTQVGMNQNMAPLSMGQPVGGAVTGVDVTASANPIGQQSAQQGGSFWKNGDGSFNTNNIQLALGGAQLLGGLWNSYQQQKIAKEQLGLSRQTFETNLANNTQTYNTALEDRIRARYNTEGRSSGEADSYLDKHSL